MAVKFSNNAKTTITGSLTTSATSVSVTDASHFPTLGAGDYTYATLAEASTPANFEIVKVTAISSNTLAITRAQQSTTARSFSSGDLCELRVTSGLMEEAIDAKADLADLSVTVNPAGAANLSYNSSTGVFSYTPPDLSGYLTSFTEVNNLTTSVTWANVPDANITQSSVTQHQSALSITESQISDLQSYLTAESDTLDAVTGRGASTTNSLTVGGLHVNSTDAVEMPVGTDAERPTPVTGMLRFNTDSASFEGYDGSAWGAIGGGGGITYTRVTANYTLSASEGVIADTSGGAFTVTLPASPSAGDEVLIADGARWGVNNLTVARNGSTIEGLASDFTLDVSGVKVGMVYDGTTWQVYPSAGAFGGASGGAFYRNSQTVSSDVTILSTENAMTTGPVSVASGVSVTVQSGARVVVL